MMTLLTLLFGQNLFLVPVAWLALIFAYVLLLCITFLSVAKSFMALRTGNLWEQSISSLYRSAVFVCLWMMIYKLLVNFVAQCLNNVSLKYYIQIIFCNCVYQVCYDWSKGAENHNPATAKNYIYLHVPQVYRPLWFLKSLSNDDLKSWNVKK